LDGHIAVLKGCDNIWLFRCRFSAIFAWLAQGFSLIFYVNPLN